MPNKHVGQKKKVKKIMYMPKKLRGQKVRK